MAQVILSGLGAALGGPVGGWIGGVIGAAADRTFLNTLSPTRQVGPRLQGVRISGASQGDPVVQVFGRVRVSGTVIWATRLKENRTTTRASKNAPRTESFGYTLSFAIALCAGPIDGIGRIWADGQLVDQSRMSFRLYHGGETQMPDALIEAVEGHAPAYRGLAYMVFEDLDLAAFGNRPPNLSVEVLRRPVGAVPGVEDLIESVCLIPGAGEFVYATTAVAALDGLTRARWETQASGDGRTNFTVALDQMQADLPNLKRVNLVVSWFGTSLDAGVCEIRPGVETADKVTTPLTWRVAGIERADAHVVSRIADRPAYGGTPSDAVVIEAITALKARGYLVTLVPFILMDCAGYPWRGRIEAETASDIESFVNGTWGLARFVRHLAQLGVAAGGVEAVLLGSELRGLTTFRDGAAYPMVTALCDLAEEVRGMVGAGTQISYAADWSEYFGHQVGGDVRFHLDPLWAHPDIDFVGIDWYAPLTDWRDGDAHLDAAEAGSIYDPDYLRGRIRGGEGFDWYYASPADRAAQIRTPITDGAYGEPWVFRPKDMERWWKDAHHDRPGGVRSAVPTAWVPRSKPVRLIEVGCAAVDKGANAPNLFLDPKSSESALPPYSSGARDDRMQRAYLKAFHDHFAAHNPLSPVYGGPMLSGMAVWAYDARPWPYFPQRGDLWGDADNWRTGHWLNGRMAAGEAGNLIAEIAVQAGIRGDELELGAVRGTVDGYVIEAPMTAVQALMPILGYLGLEVAERGGKVAFVASTPQVGLSVGHDDLAMDDDEAVRLRRDLVVAPDSLLLRCYDPDRDYQIQAVHVRGEATGGDQLTLDVPLCLTGAQALDYADHVLRRAQGVRVSVTVQADPALVLRLEPGDDVLWEGAAWRVDSVDQNEAASVVLRPVGPVRGVVAADPAQSGVVPGVVRASVMTGLRLLDIGCLGSEEGDVRPVVVISADPWAGAEVYAGAGADGLTLRGRVEAAAGVGYALTGLPVQRGDYLLHGAALNIYLEGEAPVSCTMAALRAGENALCVRAVNVAWEVLQFRHVAVLGVERYRLSGLVRGQWGTGSARRAGIDSGAEVVRLPRGFMRAQMGLDEIGLMRLWRVGVVGFGGAAQGAMDVSSVWTGQGLRPRAPVHGRVTGVGDLRVRWVRAPRWGGDGWDAEPPLCEAVERYRLRVFDGDDVVRTVEVAETSWLYAATLRAVDFPAGLDATSRIEVAQWSQVVGYGPGLWLALG